MPQPPYSPVLAPGDFFVFPKLKTPMKGKRFATIEKIKKIETGTIPQAFRGLEKNAETSVLCLRRVTLKGAL